MQGFLEPCMEFLSSRLQDLPEGILILWFTTASAMFASQVSAANEDYCPYGSTLQPSSGIHYLQLSPSSCQSKPVSFPDGSDLEQQAPRTWAWWHSVGPRQKMFFASLTWVYAATKEWDPSKRKRLLSAWEAFCCACSWEHISKATQAPKEYPAMQ